ncbi:MAG: hypothetical protein HOW73_47660 [Polyangiaceae bacterium]|nr:hypothetical protein [Polyangiaceae bacterium]
MTLTIEEAKAIALVTAQTTMELWEAKVAKSNERIRGLKAIAAEVGCHYNHIWTLVQKGKLPLDRDDFGYSIQRWKLERWRESRTIACENELSRQTPSASVQSSDAFKRKHGKRRRKKAAPRESL